ncbi:Monoglyceride lipase [Hondaea fermentalgiana]|uniref:Monoglyceride lipase n=1 Tax=Hondaea fermentalgiana TaxID=2315210 RepID=A0A2R5GB93_9STRA|nr:Monoglyceride lipase [Hondaea fermentalgiana]|eukprot:GBG25823.1 Monoglyceride lipase [Hondaea fermentalgiana]
MDEEHEFTPGMLPDSVQRRSERTDNSNWFPSNYFINKDKLAIFYRSWLPTPVAQPAIKGIVVLSHGLGEHSGRYEKLGLMFAAKGYAVYALDHQGHGCSEGTRTHVKHFIDFIHDVHQLAELAKSKHPTVKKIFLIGHSMGSLISIHAVNEAPRLFDGVVLSAPPLSLDLPPGFLSLAPVISAYLPKMQAPPLDIATLCHDPAVFDRYVSDPLNGMGPIRFRLLAELAKASCEVPEFQKDFPIPYLLMHGTADGMCSHAGSKSFYEASTIKDKTFISYPECFHELFNEPGHESKSILEALNWIEDRVDK